MKLKDSELDPFFSKIADHYGDKIVIAGYGGHGNNALNLAIECEDCCEVIVDANRDGSEK